LQRIPFGGVSATIVLDAHWGPVPRLPRPHSPMSVISGSFPELELNYLDRQVENWASRRQPSTVPPELIGIIGMGDKGRAKLAKRVWIRRPILVRRIRQAHDRRRAGRLFVANITDHGSRFDTEHVCGYRTRLDGPIDGPIGISYAAAGTGTVNHLLGEMFKLQTMTRDIVHVPYRGAGPALNDLVGGQVPIMVAAVSGQLFELHHAGKVRILAVTTPNRLPGVPEVPTVAEAGYPALTWESFIGLFDPRPSRYSAVNSRFRGFLLC
jgi:Tripartite tricarboxylate transporter family receptor